MRPRPLQPARLPQRRDARRLRRHGDAERLAHPVQHVHDRGRRVAPADARPAQAPELAESASHDRVVACVDQGGAGLVVGPLDVLGVGRVQDEQHVRGEIGPQPLDLAPRQHRAGRVVGVGEEHQARRSRHLREQRVHVGSEIALRRLAHAAPGVLPGDLVDAEPMLAHHEFRPPAAVGEAELVDQGIGPRAAHDAGRVQPEPRPDRTPQLGAAGVGVAVQLRRGGLIGSAGAGRHPESALIAGELDDPVRP